MELAGAVAVVTGGASGIGAAVVERLSKAGAKPVVWDRQAGPDGIVCDVADETSVAVAMTRTVSGHGAPSVLVTAAGVGGGLTPLVDLDVARWDEVVGVNLRGTMLCIREFGRSARPNGAVVTVASIEGHIADAGMGPYCVSKAGVEMLTRVAAAELAARGIRVNAVAPGVTATPMTAGMSAIPGLLDAIVERTPLGAVGQPEQVADAVLALLTTDWVTGQVLTVDGGLSLHSPVDALRSLSPPSKP